MNKWIRLGFLIFILQVLAFLTSYFVTEHAVSSWYQDIAKAPVNPPDWVFAPVWTTLYAMIATSLWMLWPYRRTPQGKLALSLFMVQLVANYLWSPVFFGLAAFTAAFWLIIGIDIVLAATIITTWRVVKPAALLLVPYFFWACFASYLTWSVMVLNP